MDTELDFVTESRESLLRATEAGFFRWLENNKDTNISEFLKDTWWQDYLDDLEYAYKAEKESKLKGKYPLTTSKSVI